MTRYHHLPAVGDDQLVERSAIADEQVAAVGPDGAGIGHQRQIVAPAPADARRPILKPATIAQVDLVERADLAQLEAAGGAGKTRIGSADNQCVAAAARLGGNEEVATRTSVPHHGAIRYDQLIEGAEVAQASGRCLSRPSRLRSG